MNLKRNISMKNTERLCLQLHLTDKCNQKCKHCYQCNYEEEPLALSDIENILDQYVVTVKEFNKRHKSFSRGHVNITGGEPFMREDIFEIMNLIYKRKNYFSFGILTNGTLLNDEKMKTVMKYKPDIVQVSIDGNKEHHDYIRGKGNLERVEKAIDLLKKNKVLVDVSFTVNKINQYDFAEVVEICEKHGVDVIWSDRVVPFSGGGELSNATLSVEEELVFFKSMKKEKIRLEEKGSKTKVDMGSALQFIVCKNYPYRCKVGKSMIVVDSHGDMLACRRLPLVIGNVLKTPMIDLFYKNELTEELRNLNVPNKCLKCKFSESCHGGARCQAYAIRGNIYEADPGCPIIYYGKNR